MDASVRLKPAFADHLRNDIKSVELLIAVYCMAWSPLHSYIYLNVKQILCTLTLLFAQCWLLMIRHYQDEKRLTRLRCHSHIHPMINAISYNAIKNCSTLKKICTQFSLHVEFNSVLILILDEREKYRISSKAPTKTMPAAAAASKYV